MGRPRRWVVAVVAVLIVASSAAVARAGGASWPQIVWGALGFVACALVLEFFAWLTTGGPLRLEKRPPQDTGRPE